MFIKLHKSIGMTVVAGLTPILLAVAPVSAQALTGQAQVAISATPAQVQTQPGTGVSTAGAPISGWVQIPAGGTQWYTFKYQYDDSTVTDSKGHNTQNAPEQAIVKLTMDTPGSISFAVWTPGSLQNPVHNPKDTKNGKSDHTNDVTQPVGVGTVVNLGPVKNVVENSDGSNIHGNKQQLLTDTPLPTDKKGNVLDPQVLTWVGGAAASDTYYVAVKNNSNAPAHYMLSISGPTVSFK
jgi:hypothetical protein